jgi:hypothetical protein
MPRLSPGCRGARLKGVGVVQIFSDRIPYLNNKMYRICIRIIYVFVYLYLDVYMMSIFSISYLQWLCLVPEFGVLKFTVAFHLYWVIIVQPLTN